MRNKSYIFIFINILLFLSSCVRNGKQDLIASVNDKKLFLSEVLSEMSDFNIDSSFFVRQYMNQWIKKELLIYHAKINLFGNKIARLPT